MMKIPMIICLRTTKREFGQHRKKYGNLSSSFFEMIDIYVTLKTFHLSCVIGCGECWRDTPGPMTPVWVVFETVLSTTLSTDVESSQIITEGGSYPALSHDQKILAFFSELSKFLWFLWFIFFNNRWRIWCGNLSTKNHTKMRPKYMDVFFMYVWLRGGGEKIGIQTFRTKFRVRTNENNLNLPIARGKIPDLLIMIFHFKKKIKLKITMRNFSFLSDILYLMAKLCLIILSNWRTKTFLLARCFWND